MIKIIEATNLPITTIGQTASICYDSIPLNKVFETKENNKRAFNIGKHCLKSGHTRTAEFAKVRMVIDEYSARVIRELYTHIVGTSKVQASTRYIKYNGDKFGYYTPNSINKNEQAKEIYDDAMNEILAAYNKLLDLGIRQQDVANILPLGHHTTIVYEINVRALMHLFNLRTCSRAYEEFRKLMKELKSELYKLDDEWKYLCDNYFITKCEATGYCDESETCGRKPKKEKI